MPLKSQTELSMTILANAVGLLFCMRRRHAYKLVLANALLLLCLSWLPGRFMVRTEILSAQAEHAVAYFVTGFAVTLVLAGYRTAWHIALGLVAYAGLLELGQYFAPGRHASLSDFTVSATGGLAGVVFCALLIQAYSRRLRVRRLQPSTP
jgi:VanZ family protein